MINDDLPTLDRPINANSGLSCLGHFFTSELDITNSAVFIFIGSLFSTAKLYIYPKIDRINSIDFDEFDGKEKPLPVSTKRGLTIYFKIYLRYTSRICVLPVGFKVTLSRAAGIKTDSPFSTVVEIPPSLSMVKSPSIHM